MPNIEKFANRLNNIKEAPEKIELIVDINNEGFENGYRSAIKEHGVNVNATFFNDRFSN